MLSWLISPLAAAAFGAALFLITKYVVLKAPDSHARLVTLYPAYVTATFAVVIFFMVLSGAPALKLTKHVNGRQKITNPWAVVGVTLALCAVVYAAAWKGRQTKFFERYIDSIPFASREDGHHTELTQPASKVDKADAAEAGVVVAAAGANGVNGNGKAAKEDDEGERVGLLGDGGKSHEGRDAPASHAPPKDGDVVGGGGGGDEPYAHESTAAAEAAVGAPPPGAPGAVAALRRFAVSGLDQDIVTPQSEAAVAAHAAATRFDPRTERLFSAVQVFTAAFASLAHGSNDVANAVAPLSVSASCLFSFFFTENNLFLHNPIPFPSPPVSLVWAHGGSVVSASSPTPTWCLAYGGLFIDAGLVLYGYKVMRSLGNNITYHSPSRGFSMELAALTTVLWASSVGAAVSTTHCITGATVGVGLCTGRLDAVNWRMVAWTSAFAPRCFSFCFFSFKIASCADTSPACAVMGWVITLPCAGIVAGLLFALIAQSPKTLSSAAAHPGLAFSPPPPMAPSNFTSTSTG